MLRQFLPRFNRRFQVPDQCSEPAYRSPQPDLRLELVLCFKHRRRMARDNTVKFQKRTLQLLPSLERPSYAGAQVVILQSLDGRLSLEHAGSIIAAQEAPPSPGTIRKAEGTLPTAPVQVPDPGLPSTSSANSLTLLNSRAAPDDDHTVSVDDAATGELQVVPSPAKPTFLQRERWKVGSAGQAQGTVDSGDGQGVGHSPQHGEEIH